MAVRLVLYLVLPALLSAAGADRPPNVVLVMADDVGYECFSSYGSRQYHTPRIDSLADGGVRFTNCYSTPLCTPTRVALMTGQSNVRNYTDFGALEPGEYTIANLFSEAGYATAVAGKWQLQGSGKARGVPAGDGFDRYCLWNTGKTGRNRFWNPSLECDGKILETKRDDYGPDLLANFLLRFMEAHRDRPFFVYYPMVLVHSPFVPTPHSQDRESTDRQRNFEDMVAYTDHLVGRLQDKLEELQLLRDTILVFTSDNGTHHTLLSELPRGGIRGDKGAPTDAGTHVPLVVSAPGRIAGGRVVEDLIDFADFLPTLAEGAGLALPEALAIDGISFWDQLMARQGRPRPWHYTYYFPRPYAQEFLTPYTHPEVAYVRDKRFKLYATGELFDVKADPEERRALSASDGPVAAVRRKLEAALASMPVRGASIPSSRSRASRGASRPRWPSH